MLRRGVGISVLVAQGNLVDIADLRGNRKRGRSTGEHGYASERRGDMWGSSMAGRTLV